MADENIEQFDFEKAEKTSISQPLVKHIFTADPSVHVFEGKIYIYPSHDIEAGIPFNDLGDHFGMEDYHILSMDTPSGVAEDHGVALHVKDVPWAERQMWAPDAAYKNGKYYFYFPAKNYDGKFQIGVAIGDLPAGPFIAEPEAIKGTYSIDPAVFKDEDGKYYMYFGGIWGGQLQSYRNNEYSEGNVEPLAHEPALGSRVALLADDMKEFAETVREIIILDEEGNPILSGDNERRFFEASWMHRYNGKYYFSYSTGDTHFICYAIGDNPYGPFTYQGRILNPVLGWTNHHAIIEFNGKWYLFYHDVQLSGETHLRNVKVTELKYNDDGSIQTIDAYRPSNASE
ncbi:MAG: glycoside hydrolase family 43 protein [Ferruginibacter sp.]